ncbi:MAG: glycoside hydrolase family 97 N-terminal domain-containing protein, partial [Bryobacteraceae bacterium]
MLRSVSCIFISLICAAPAAHAQAVTLASPDGQIELRLNTEKNLVYSVHAGGKPVIEPSRVGIIIDKVDLSEDVSAGEPELYQTNERYPWYGPHSTAVDRGNGARLNMVHRKSGTKYTLELRAYNDGVAFRHIVAGVGRRVLEEATSFRLPAGSIVWIHGTDGHYEEQHVRKSLRAVAPGEWTLPPLTARLPEDTGYISITESALREYSGMALQADGTGVFHARLGHRVPASYPFRLRYESLVGKMSQPAAITGVITTPWRVVLVGRDLNTLVNSDIIHNLAPPPDPKLFPKGILSGWIKPGRAVWSYLDGGRGTLEGMKEFSRLASELGFEYNVLEGFWARWPEAQLKELTDYSRKLGVQILLWKHSRDLRTPPELNAFLDLCVRNGVAGAKVDFFDHEHKDIVDLYETILRAAAERKLIIDFHGSNKPTGMERTWPNMLGTEAIRGLESRPPYAQHDVTLPFTRMLAGLADYTPVVFGRRMADTTWAHQVANAILLPAPLLVYG